LKLYIELKPIQSIIIYRPVILDNIIIKNELFYNGRFCFVKAVFTGWVIYSVGRRDLVDFQCAFCPPRLSGRQLSVSESICHGSIISNLHWNWVSISDKHVVWTYLSKIDKLFVFSAPWIWLIDSDYMVWISTIAFSNQLYSSTPWKTIIYQSPV